MCTQDTDVHERVHIYICLHPLCWGHTKENVDIFKLNPRYPLNFKVILNLKYMTIITTVEGEESGNR